MNQEAGNRLQGHWVVALDGTHQPPRERVGGKAASLARMRLLGLPVPPAFVVTTEACRDYLKKDQIADGLVDELSAGILWLEAQTGRRFGAGPSPLLVSVRSGAAISMPGMMDTILNLGSNATTMAALAEESGDAGFAADSYRRFHELYAGIVLKLPDPALGDDAKTLIERSATAGVPQDVHMQLQAAVRAVFESWRSRRAKRYRKHHGIPDDLGTAVTVQAMVFGNLDNHSGTGVLFTRNPLTGERQPYGEYLARAQGEDVVSGRVTPEPVAALATAQPQIHAQLMVAGERLEAEHGEVQDIEFTVQQGVLYLLQARTAKRAPAAAVRCAVDMVAEGVIDPTEALARVSPTQVRSLLSPRLAEGAAVHAVQLAAGQGASPGIGVGMVVTDADEADRRHQAGEAVVLARTTTSPEDVHGMLAARAVVTEQGGSTSHAAVVGRSLGLPCVVGCGDGVVAKLAGATVTVDGSAGAVYAGALDVVAPGEADDGYLAQLLEWARQSSPLAVHRCSEAPTGADIVDLDAVPGGEDPERLPALLAGREGARGGAIASDAGVAAAVAAGLKFIVAEPLLPPLLAAIAAVAR